MKNPPAFPRARGESRDGVAEEQKGMTLLDYFAGQAMQGIMTDEVCRSSGRTQIARDSYLIAQAMLEEREKHL